MPGVERAVEGLASGATLEIVVPPDEAYGERDAAGVFVVPPTKAEEMYTPETFGRSGTDRVEIRAD